MQISVRNISALRVINSFRLLSLLRKRAYRMEFEAAEGSSAVQHPPRDDPMESEVEGETSRKSVPPTKSKGRPKKIPLLHRAFRGSGRGGQLTCEKEPGKPCNECARIRTANEEAEAAWEQDQIKDREEKRDWLLAKKKAREMENEENRRQKQLQKDKAFAEKLESELNIRESKEECHQAAGKKAEKTTYEKKREEPASTPLPKFSGTMFFTASSFDDYTGASGPTSTKCGKSLDDASAEIAAMAMKLQSAKTKPQKTADAKDKVNTHDACLFSKVEQGNFKKGTNGKPSLTPEETFVMGQIIAKHDASLTKKDRPQHGLRAKEKEAKLPSRFLKLDLGFDGQQDSTLTKSMIESWPSEKLYVLASIARRLNTKVRYVNLF